MSIDINSYKFAEKETDKLEAVKDEPLEVILKTFTSGHIFCYMRDVHPNGISGDAFRDWCAGVFKNGVYFHTRRHSTEIRCTERPDIKVKRGSQDSCCWGNPMPEPLSGDWVYLNNMPKESIPYITKVVHEIISECIPLLRIRFRNLRNRMRQQSIEEIRATRILKRHGRSQKRRSRAMNRTTILFITFVYCMFRALTSPPLDSNSVSGISNIILSMLFQSPPVVGWIYLTGISLAVLIFTLPKLECDRK